MYIEVRSSLSSQIPNPGGTADLNNGTAHSIRTLSLSFLCYCHILACVRKAQDLHHPHGQIGNAWCLFEPS